MNSFAGSQRLKFLGDFWWFGVDLFFVLSGFLITDQLFRRPSEDSKASVLKFYLRRGLRIWPTYLVVLLLYFKLADVVPALAPAIRENSALPPLWKFLTFTQNFGLDIVAAGAFFQAWSLCVEEQFYLVLPFVIIIFAKFGNLRSALVTLVIVLLAGLFIRNALWHHFVEPWLQSSQMVAAYIGYYREIYCPAYCRLDGLAIGVAIASFRHFRKFRFDSLMPYSNWFFLGSVLWLIVTAKFVAGDILEVATTFGFLSIDLACGCLVVAALSSTGLLAEVRIPGLRFMAGFTYSFYLIHKPIILISKQILKQAHWNTESVGYLLLISLACVAAAIALHVLVEKPSLSLRRQIF